MTASCALLIGSPQAALAADDLTSLDLATLMQMDVTLVTAQRRTENVNTVPISMIVVKADAVHGLKLNGTPDLQFAAPGLTTSNNAVWMLPYIRGIGTDINSSGTEPSVAVYVDGIYQAERVRTFVDSSDVEQIEVLKGPQGTLYGRNATGGAINVTTRGPSDHLESSVALDTGNLDLREGSGFIAGPVTDRVRASLSAHARERDGYYENITNGKNVDGDEFQSLHGRVQIDVSSALSAEVLLKYFHRKGMSSYGTEVSGNSRASRIGAQVATEPFETASDLDASGFRSDAETAALKLNWDVSSLHLQSISAYSEQDQNILVDFDMSNAKLAHLRGQERGHAFTQELQLTPTQKPENLDWLLGAFYINSSDRFAPLAIDMTSPTVGPFTRFVAGTVETQSYAAFGEATLALNESFSVTGGLRYSTEEKRLADAATGVENFFVQTFPDREHRWDDVNYRLVAKYMTGSSTLYAKTETGFKSGVYNNANPPNPGPIDPEKITAYEIGIKSALPHYPLRISAAAFFNDYRDLQTQVVDPSAGGITRLIQAPRAETYGIDLNVDSNVSTHWSVSSGVAWLQAEYRDFVSSGTLLPSPNGGLVAVANLDLAGNHLARSPELAANISAACNYPVLTGTVFCAANYYRSSRVYFDPANVFSQDGFGVLHAQLGYRSSAGWWVSAWAKNLTNETYLATVVPAQLGAFGQYAEPRTYGVSVGYASK